MASKLYRLRIATAGATAVAGFVDLTITSTQLAEVPTIPGPIARPLDGKTEAQPWSVTLRSSAIHGDIADAEGRLDLGGRLCDWSESTDDGSTYTVLWTGRLTGLSSPDPATFKATLEDERFLERRSVIFATNKGSVQICPPGPRAQWRHDTGGISGRAATMRVTEVGSTDAVHLEWKDGWTCSRGALDFVASDTKADADPRKDQGNFTHTRLNVGGTDREVISFALGRNGHDAVGDIEDEVGGPSMWVYWPAHGLTQWQEVDACYLYAPTAPPTPDLPLLIGGSSGVTDAQLAQDIYSGNYGATDEAGNPVAIRYDATAFAALKGEACWFVVDGPENMAAWVEEHIYRPRHWTPFTNASGQVAPRSTALPRNIDYTALTTLDASTVLEPYPEWDYAARDSVTALTFKVRKHYRIRDAPPEDGDFPSSLIKWRTQTVERNHDNISSMGRVSRTIAINRDAAGFPMLDAIAREYFERVGDGVIRIPALRTSVALEAGDFVTLDSDTLKLPNPNTNARSGGSIWQVLKRDRLPGTGYAVELGYAGPSIQELAAPTVGVAQNASVPQHLVDVSISGLGTDEGYILEVDRGNGAGWVIARAGRTNETVTIGRCPSGTAVSFRALTTKRNRIRSAYSATASVTTASITAPSLFTGTVKATTVAGEWTNGDATYAVMPTLDGVDVLDEPLDAGSDAYIWQGLKASTTYTLGVKHVDPYGGASALTTLSKTTGAGSTLTAPSGLGVVQGRGSAAETPPFFLVGSNVGVEFAWDNAGEGADTEWQVARDSGFTNVIRQGIAENAGARVGRVWVRTGFLSGLLYIRIRSIKDGYTASAWAKAISTYGTFLKDSGGPRQQELLANTDAGALAYLDTVTADELTKDSQAFNTDIVFSAADHDTIQWTAGSIRTADGTTYSITAGSTGSPGAGASGRWIYLNPATSTTAFLVTSTYSDAVGDGKIILCYWRPAPSTSQSALFVPVVGTLGINEDNISAGSISAGKIQANAVTASKINVVDLSAINANMGTLTAGLITAGNTTISADNETITMGSATSPTVGTGIFLGKDGLDYEFRAGDPAANNIHWDGTNLSLNGGFVATSLAPDSAIAKRIAYGFSDLLPGSDATPYNVNIMSGEGAITYTGGSSFGLFFQSIVVPPGVTLTAIRARLYRATTSDTAEVKLYQNATTTPSLLATLTHSTTGWATVSDTSLSQVVGQQETYMATVKLKGAATTDDARYSQIFIDWSMANYDHAL